MKTRRVSGFTIVELIIVLIAGAILATVAVISYKDITNMTPSNANTSAIPTIVGSTATNTTNGTSSGLTITTSSKTKKGDLVIIAGYVEPANEGNSSATFGTTALPPGVSLLPGFPVETDASDITTGNDHRLYVWYYYATVSGSQSLTFTNTADVYWGFTSVSIHGGPTVGDPLAEPASTNRWSRNSSPTGTTPPVSLSLSDQNTLVLWVVGDWTGPEPGLPNGYNTVVTSTNWNGQPAIAAQTYTLAGDTGIVSGTQSSNDSGTTVALLSFRHE